MDVEGMIRDLVERVETLETQVIELQPRLRTSWDDAQLTP
jgi:hypothetical protein